MSINKNLDDTDTYNEALNNYYKLKNDYENKLNSKKLKIITNPLLDLKDKKREISSSKKCINCNRSGGTIFKYENGNLIALCNASKPCNLNISIKKSKVIDIKSLLNNLENKIEEIKINIIKVKLDFLFNFNNQELSLQLFEKFKLELQDLNVKYNDVFVKLMDIINNEERKNKINENILLQDEIVNKIKILNNEYDKSKSTLLIGDIIEIYINELIKINDVLLNLKYKYNNVEKNKDTKEKIYKLNQYKNNFNEFEIISEQPKVNSYKK
jgi:hypothetical protein